MRRIFPYGVLAAFGQNDVSLSGLTPAYGVREVDDSVSKKKGKRPSRTSTNARVVLPAFKENGNDDYEQEMKIPRLFCYYNEHKGEADRLNALVAAYTSQRACNRVWMPLFNWHPDGSLTNAFKLSKSLSQSPKEHQQFLEAVVVDLLQEGDSCRIRPVRGNHEWIDLKSIRACFTCRIGVKNRGFGRDNNGDRGNAPRTRGGCGVCSLLMPYRQLRTAIP